MAKIKSSEPIAVNDNTGRTVGSPEQLQDSRSLADTGGVTIENGLETVTATAKRNELPKNISSISNFLARNQISGFAKTNRYFVQFSIQNILPGLTSEDSTKYLSFLCESVDLPGRDMTVTDNRIYGPIYKTPTLSTYPDVNMTFLCDSSLSQKQLFEEWMNIINPNTNFDFSYRESYVTDIDIHQINEVNDVMHTITLNNAFPTSIGALQSSWGDDAFHKIQVTFAYDYWNSKINKVQERVQYDMLQQEHIVNIATTAFQYGGFGKGILNQIENQEHVRRVQKSDEESRARFKSIIANLK